MTLQTAPADLLLDTRTGLPDDLRILLARYPRETWDGHANLGKMARFWLQRHDMFRELGGALQGATQAFRDGTATTQDFQAWFVPRLQFFLQQLNGHHHVEDHHYFPIFREADARLVRGFEVLDSDHHLIHGSIIGAAEAANAFLSADGADADQTRRTGERYAVAGDALTRQLLRHLEDEEDLIIPLILDRTEGGLGVG